ncbi:MAG: rhombosortase [Desulfuromonadales bacterium]|nr:MAG: rhombosortase [Desulfuromonadales bacterium]
MVRQKRAPVMTAVPWVSLGLTAAAVALFLSPPLAELLVYDREAIAAGEVWRLLTGHLVHFSREHLLGNGAAMLLTETFLRREGAGVPRRFWCIAPLAVGLALFLFLTDLPIYGGLSGIACGAIVLLAGRWLRGGRPEQVAALLLLVGVGAKVLLEAYTCQPLLAAGTAPFVPVPLAHLVGAAVGAFLAVMGHCADGAMNVNAECRRAKMKSTAHRTAIVACHLIMAGAVSPSMVPPAGAAPVPQPVPLVALPPEARLSERIYNLPGLSNVGRVTPGIYRGAQPGPEGYETLRKLGIRTVIDLRTTESEQGQVEAAGMKAIALPITMSRDGLTEKVDRVVALMADPANQPVFVHCRHGQDRTGIVVAAYRMKVERWSLADAESEMQSFGFNDVWVNFKKFIRKYAANLPKR